MSQVCVLFVVRIGMIVIGMTSYVVNGLALTYGQYDGTVWPSHALIAGIGILGILLPDSFENTREDWKGIFLTGFLIASTMLPIEYSLKLGPQAPILPYGVFSFFSLLGSCGWVIVGLAFLLNPPRRQPVWT